MPGSASAAFAAALLVTGLLAGCSAVGGTQPPSPPLPGVPAVAPRGGPAPVGTVLPLDGKATTPVVDPSTATVATALSDPPRLLLQSLDSPAGAPPPREVPLPGPVADVTLAGDGSPLLVSVSEPGSLVQVPLDGGAPSTTDLDGAPRDAVMLGDRIVVALGERLAVLERDGSQRTIAGFIEAAALAPAGAKVAVLDRGRSTLSLVDPASGDGGPRLRAGNGPANAVPDRFGRILVTDVHDGELLAFSSDPLLLRQRFPLPGAPYGLAYDRRRDLAWVTLTARNEVVGLDMAGGEPMLVHRFPTVHQPDAVAVDPVSGRVVIVSASGAGLQVVNPGRMVH